MWGRRTEWECLDCWAGSESWLYLKTEASGIPTLRTAKGGAASSEVMRGKAKLGQPPGNKYITPMIVNGKVYVGTTNGVGVFGLLGGE